MSIELPRRRGTGRHYTPARLRVEQRAAADGSGRMSPVLVGHAAVFNQTTTIYDYKYWRYDEKIRPGAFSRALREKQDVRSLFNHEECWVLGRTAAGTLVLSEDETGLYSETTAPDNQTIRDLVISPIERGDITGMSFAFMPFESEVTTTVETPDGCEYDTGGEIITITYEGDKMIETHELVDLDLYDVSPVTFPAYAGADLAVRSLPDLTDRIREMNRPHRRHAKTPRLDALRSRLEARASSARHPRKGSAPSGR